MGDESSILAVEEDAKARKRIAGALEGLRLRLLEADAFEQAYELFRAEQPLAVLVSVKRAAQAIEFIARLATEDPGISLIAVVDGRTAARTLVESAQAGCTGFVKKPVSAVELRSLISRIALAAESKKQASFPQQTIEALDLHLTIRSKSGAVNAALKLIASALSGIVERGQLSRFTLAIDEAVRNAYEHGSLGITGTQKFELCEAELFEDVLHEKERTDAVEGKVIAVHLRCDAGEICCTVEDQGAGFDWREVPSPSDETDINTALHGRGLMLIRSVFDTVAFNEKGNKVTLAKKLR